MTDRLPPASAIAAADAPSARPAIGLWKAVLIATAVTIALLFLNSLKNTDYVGIDNDDAMRLVEVRDFAAGQSWFDMTQYRLGPEGGTDMHWSRLVDLPIASMITLFSPFAAPETAERIALTLWPLILVLPLLYGIGRASLHLGGRPAMVAGLVLGTIIIVCGLKFRPGAIDHHNVQMSLIALTIAGLLDPLRRPASFACQASPPASPSPSARKPFRSSPPPAWSSAFSGAPWVRR